MLARAVGAVWLLAATATAASSASRAAAAAAPAPAEAAASAAPRLLTIAVDGDTPWVLQDASTAGGGLPPAFELALRDVRRDWYTTLGRPPVTLNTYYPWTLPGHLGNGVTDGLVPPPPAPSPDATGTFVFLGDLTGLATTLPAAALAAVKAALGAEPESHACFTLPPAAGKWAYTAIVCTGVDALGVAFATYEFSHAVLGVDPQAYWTDHEPMAGDASMHASSDAGRHGGTRRVAFTAAPMGDETGLVYRILRDPATSADPAPSLSPHWRYRGFFINDEDLLGEWAPDPLGRNVFSLHAWDRILQQILRLKGDCVIVGTATYADETALDLAMRRGLYIAEHHITPLGVNTFQWPQGVPFSFGKAPETLEYAYKSTVAQAVQASPSSPSSQHLWTVGLRGLNDYPFWNDDPSYKTDKERGELISAGMAAQAKIAQAAEPGAPMFTYLWSEMTGLFDAGTLTIPDGVTVVHADRGNGFVDPHDLDLAKPGHGLYFHIAVEGGKQMTETVPVSRAANTLASFEAKNATHMIILNLSDIKPVPMGARFVMEYVWDSSPYAGMHPDDVQQKYLRSWLATQFGNGTVSELLDLYTAYFDIPYIVNETLTVHMGEGDVAQTARRAARNIMGMMAGAAGVDDVADGDGGDPRAALHAVRRGRGGGDGSSGGATERIAALYNEVVAAVAKVPASRQAFMRSHIVAQLAIWMHTSAIADNVTTCAEAAKAGDNSTALLASGAALEHSEALLTAMRGAESAVFRGLYLAEELDGFWNLRDVLVNLHAHLQGTALSPERPWRFGTGRWNSWFQYDEVPVHHDGDATYPFFGDYPEEPSWGFGAAVRFGCGAGAGVSCNISVIGGNFAGAAGASVTLASLGSLPSGASIRYAVSDSVSAAPTASSPAFSKAFTVGAGAAVGNGTFVAAQVFLQDGTALDPLTRAFFNRTL